MLGDVYLTTLEGALPVAWKYEIIICPPDCGGADSDEIEYRPRCPKCDKHLNILTKYNFCPHCGQKLWWHVKYPRILGNEE